MATSVEECEQQIQGLIVISCAQNTSNHQLIQKILRHKQQNESQEYEPKSLNLGTDVDFNGFDLKIDNKYYSANIFLFDMKDKHLFSERLADSVNGVILYFDSNHESTIDCLNSSIDYINQFDNEIKLLVCQTIDDIRRQLIDKWCLDNEFELVEVCPQHQPSDDDLEDLEDIDGMTRILQAIEAHHWPNSSLKDPPKYNPSQHFKSLIEREDNVNGVENRSQNNSSHHLSDESTDSPDIQEFEDFNHLFEKFSEMKVKSSQMSENERKDYAEKVTIAFWKAIGGDINEIEGLEDNSDLKQ